MAELPFPDPLLGRYSNPLTTRVTEADARANFGRQKQARLRGEKIDFALACQRSCNYVSAHIAAADEPTVAAGGASLYDTDLEFGIVDAMKTTCRATRSH